METIKIINPDYFAKHPNQLNLAIDVLLLVKSHKSATIYPDKIVFDSEDNDSQADDSNVQNKGYIEPVGILKLSEAINLIFEAKIHEKERKVFLEEIMGFTPNSTVADFAFKEVETILKFCDKTKTLPSSLFLLAELLGGLNDHDEFVDPAITTIWQNYDHSKANN